MKTYLFIALILAGLLISCSSSTVDNSIEIETDGPGIANPDEFAKQVNESLIAEEEYIEIGELI